MGLIGGIVSGKLVICKRLEGLGVGIVDCDKLGILMMIGWLLLYNYSNKFCFYFRVLFDIGLSFINMLI